MDMKVAPRLRAGIGQGFFIESSVPKLTVRIRSGQEVRRGSFYGDEKHPTAFVWVDEPDEAPSKELILRVGKAGRYLWQHDAPVELTELFPGDKPIAKLDTRLADWQGYFERYYDPKTPNRFYWGRFHQEGLQLARQLQALLIDRAVIRYLRPIEDRQVRYAPELSL